MEKYSEINENSLNIKCKTYFCEPESTRKIVVSCHGFGGSKDSGSSKILAKKLSETCPDTAVMTFDWPCHGEDMRKKLALTDCDAYLDEVIRYVSGIYGAENIYGNANSFGGYLLLKYIREHGNPFRKITLRCPAVKMHDVLCRKILTEADMAQLSKGNEVTPGTERKPVITSGFVESLATNDITKRDYREFSNVILITHGTDDETVSFDDVRQFADMNSIAFIPIEGADHLFRDPDKISKAFDLSAEFLFGKQNP